VFLSQIILEDSSAEAKFFRVAAAGRWRRRRKREARQAATALNRAMPGGDSGETGARRRQTVEESAAHLMFVQGQLRTDSHHFAKESFETENAP
jgi:hypothetical protein